MRYVLGGMAVVLCATSLFAQKAESKAAPSVPIDLREKFFKAQSEYQVAAAAAAQANQTAQAKNVTLQAEVDKLKAACGTEYIPNVDKDGEIVCVDKPKTPEPAKK